MNREDAEKHLREIGKFSRAEPRRNQQLWLVYNDKYFSHLAVGYDKQDRVEFVSAIANPKTEEKMRFEQVGDINKAEARIAGPNHTYVWKIPESGDNADFEILAYGKDEKFISTLTLKKPETGNESEEDE